MSVEIVAAVRDKYPFSNPGYPNPLGPDHAAFLLEVAAELNKGLVIKPTGTRITLPDGVSVSQDVVMLPTGQAWDILRDGEGAAEPVYNAIEPIDPARFYQVEGLPEPELPPDEASFERDVRASLARVEQNQAVLLANQANIEQKINLLLVKPAPVPEVQFPTYQTKVFGQTISSTPVGGQ